MTPPWRPVVIPLTVPLSRQSGPGPRYTETSRHQGLPSRWGEVFGRSSPCGPSLGRCLLRACCVPGSIPGFGTQLGTQEAPPGWFPLPQSLHLGWG